jgi:hypothetical protein
MPVEKFSPLDYSILHLLKKYNVQMTGVFKQFSGYAINGSHSSESQPIMRLHAVVSLIHLLMYSL